MANALETFSRTTSLPMFRKQEGCLALFFTRTETECATVTVWSSPEAAQFMESSAEYQHAVREIESSGILGGNHTTEVFSVYGGFTADSLSGALRATRG